LATLSAGDKIESLKNCTTIKKGIYIPKTSTAGKEFEEMKKNSPERANLYELFKFLEFSADDVITY
jgi:arsenate reductase-like glutaredoxin family protein